MSAELEQRVIVLEEQFKDLTREIELIKSEQKEQLTRIENKLDSVIALMVQKLDTKHVLS